MSYQKKGVCQTFFWYYSEQGLYETFSMRQPAYCPCPSIGLPVMENGALILCRRLFYKHKVMLNFPSALFLQICFVFIMQSIMIFLSHRVGHIGGRTTRIEVLHLQLSLKCGLVLALCCTFKPFKKNYDF